HRWNIISAAMLPSQVSTPRSSAAMAFSRPLTMSSRYGRSILTTASAVPVSWVTATCPLLIVRYQCCSLLPLVTSKRNVADSPANVAIWPGGARPAKNSLIGSAPDFGAGGVGAAGEDRSRADLAGAVGMARYVF